MRGKPTRDEIRRALSFQCCPFCGAGPFRVVAQHVWVKHGVTAYALREAAGWTRNHRLVDASYHEEQSRRCSTPDWLARTALLNQSPLMIQARRKRGRTARPEAIPKILAAARLGAAFRVELTPESASEGRRVAAINRGRRAIENPPRCGTTTRYRYGCRCPLCRAANTDSHRRYMATCRAKGQT